MTGSGGRPYSLRRPMPVYNCWNERRSPLCWIRPHVPWVAFKPLTVVGRGATRLLGEHSTAHIVLVVTVVLLNLDRLSKWWKSCEPCPT